MKHASAKNTLKYECPVNTSVKMGFSSLACQITTKEM